MKFSAVSISSHRSGNKSGERLTNVVYETAGSGDRKTPCHWLAALTTLNEVERLPLLYLAHDKCVNDSLQVFKEEHINWPNQYWKFKFNILRINTLEHPLASDVKHELWIVQRLPAEPLMHSMKHGCSAGGLSHRPIKVGRKHNIIETWKSYKTKKVRKK